MTDPSCTVVVDPSVSAADCRRCGACCVYEIQDEMSDDGRCICLVGPVGIAVRCCAYRQRPQTCRDYTPGSARCLESRRAMLAGPAAGERR